MKNMKNITAQPGQCITDICMQEYGTILALKELHELNNFANIPQEINAGDIIMVDPDSPLVDKIAIRAMRDSTVATINTTEVYEGIEYWAIENNFVIQ